jgi:lipopolysaccharide transport system ATP-binding protein
MSDTVISVRNLGKKYRLGATVSMDTLRDHIMHAAGRLFSRSSLPAPRSTELWALKDVSFDVQQGEVLGIIGPNGAGKSTTLKILTGITEPTEGEIRMKGRVGSLLEVGTGFHQELTGRENIYMNGAILGMTRAEINAKFDEIVAFSGVEKFLDTPVKRYSSGMRVRLGFAVAAHLEPEVLIVDEVLAVGDADFQKKCVGKMKDVAGHGRTVLFVSHNMGSITNLCTSCVLMKDGTITERGSTSDVISRYLAAGEPDDAQLIPLGQRQDRSGSGVVRFTDCRVSRTPDGEHINEIFIGDPLYITLTLESNERVPVWVGVDFNDGFGAVLMHTSNRTYGLKPLTVNGAAKLVLHIPRFVFCADSYTIDIRAVYAAPVTSLADRITAASLTVLSRDMYDSGYPVGSRVYGKVHLENTWSEVT